MNDFNSPLHGSERNPARRPLRAWGFNAKPIRWILGFAVLNGVVLSALVTRILLSDPVQSSIHELGENLEYLWKSMGHGSLLTGP